MAFRSFEKKDFGTRHMSEEGWRVALVGGGVGMPTAVAGVRANLGSGHSSSATPINKLAMLVALLVAVASWNAALRSPWQPPRLLSRASLLRCDVGENARRHGGPSNRVTEPINRVAGATKLLAQLQTRLGLSEEQLQTVVIRAPQVLGYSFESKIEPSLANLQVELANVRFRLQRWETVEQSL